MTIDTPHYTVGGYDVGTALIRYDVDTALSLLGPANYGAEAPTGCLDYLVLIIKNLVISLWRIFNYICGDHQWYNNHTARHIVDEFVRESQVGAQDPILIERVRELAQCLAL